MQLPAPSSEPSQNVGPADAGSQASHSAGYQGELDGAPYDSDSEPNPERTASEILEIGFWSLDLKTGRYEFSKRAINLLGTSVGTNRGFEGLVSEEDAPPLKADILRGLSFVRIVSTVTGRSVLVSGRRQDGYRPRIIGNLIDFNHEAPVVRDGSPDLLALEAVEIGIESLLVLKAVRGVSGHPVDFEVVWINRGAAKNFGVSPQDAVGQLLGQLVPDVRTNGVVQRYASVMASRTPLDAEFHAVPGGYNQRWFREQVFPITDGVAVLATDVTETRRIGDASDRSKRMLERIASTTPDVLLLWDADSTRFVYSNRALDIFARGRPPKSLLELAGAMVDEDREKLDRHIEQLRRSESGRLVEESFRLRSSDGSLRCLLFRSSLFEASSDPLTRVLLTTAQDVSEQISSRSELESRMRELMAARGELEARKFELEELNSRLSQMASTDGLTDVANRRSFEEKLEEEVERAQRYNSRLALLLADVDNFKAYNDKHGHPGGDQALKAFARVLTQVCRRSDTVARYGGEEFAVILPNSGAEEAGRLGERIRIALAETLPGKQGATTSIGCAELVPGKDAKNRLVEDADRALYESKNSGKDRVTVARG